MADRRIFSENLNICHFLVFVACLRDAGGISPSSLGHYQFVPKNAKVLVIERDLLRIVYGNGFAAQRGGNLQAQGIVGASIKFYNTKLIMCEIYLVVSLSEIAAVLHSPRSECGHCSALRQTECQ